MYEVSSVKRGSELFLRSLVGGPQRVGQRDRLFSLSVRRRVSKRRPASDFIMDEELPALVRHGAQLVPVLVQPCLWQEYQQQRLPV